MVERALRALALLLWTPAGCTCFGPLPEALGAALAARAAEPGAVRFLGTVTITSESLTGTFVAALAAQRSPHPKARLQLFTDVGGKVVDLAVTESRVEGRFSGGAVGYSADLTTARPPYHPLLFFAVTLLDVLAPLTRERVLGARATAGGHELRLVGPPHTEVRVTVAADGTVLSRTLTIGFASWRVTVVGHGLHIVAPGFELTLDRDSEEPAEHLPDTLFRLSTSGADW